MRLLTHEGLTFLAWDECDSALAATAPSWAQTLTLNFTYTVAVFPRYLAKRLHHWLGAKKCLFDMDPLFLDDMGTSENIVDAFMLRFGLQAGKVVEASQVSIQGHPLKH